MKKKKLLANIINENHTLNARAGRTVGRYVFTMVTFLLIFFRYLIVTVAHTKPLTQIKGEQQY